MKIAFILLLFVGAASAQTATPYPVVGQPWYQPSVYVPASSTSVCTVTCIWSALWLNNTSGSSVTVTVTDNSTQCGGSACQLWGASIAANTIQSGPVPTPGFGIVATGGLKWSASTGSAVVGYLAGYYPTNLVASVEEPDDVFAMNLLPAWFFVD